MTTFICEYCQHEKGICELNIVFVEDEPLVVCDYCVSENLITDAKGNLVKRSVSDILWVKQLLKGL